MGVTRCKRTLLLMLDGSREVDIFQEKMRQKTSAWEKSLPARSTHYLGGGRNQRKSESIERPVPIYVALMCPA